jgi:hypothetical protein
MSTARIARCDVFTSQPLNGVCVRVVHVDDQNAIVKDVHVIYTPDAARQVAHNILVEADKVEALGEPTPELLTICAPNPEADRRRIRSYS